jgi:hypothetical protein
MKKIVITIGVLVFIGLFVFAIKFILLFTPGTSVIKEYSYSGGVNEFISHVKSYSSMDSNVIYKITDTIGSIRGAYKIYMDIDLKSNGRDISYGIVVKNNNDNAIAGTAIVLVMAIDKIALLGGYNSNAKGVKPLVSYFEANFFTPLSDSENIKITPLNGPK